MVLRDNPLLPNQHLNRAVAPECTGNQLQSYDYRAGSLNSANLVVSQQVPEIYERLLVLAEYHPPVFQLGVLGTHWNHAIHFRGLHLNQHHNVLELPLQRRHDDYFHVLLHDKWRHLL